MSRRRVALLDVNVLVALFDPDHIHHEIAHDWFAGQRKSGWATCPLTENGFLRTASRVARRREPIPLPTLIAGLRAFIASGHHERWTDDMTLLDEQRFRASGVLGHHQLTDVYLLALAVAHKGLLATFDQKIAVEVVKGARREHLAVLAPAAAR